LCSPRFAPMLSLYLPVLVLVLGGILSSVAGLEGESGVPFTIVRSHQALCVVFSYTSILPAFKRRSLCL
jgi:hypothetical protein